MFRSVLGHFFKSSRFTSDNFVFRLHYRVTLGLLLTGLVVILWTINFGRPIYCSRGNSDHCWYYGTFTYADARYKKVGVEVPAPGIDVSGEEVVWHTTHQWITLCLLVQALFFYLPRLFWRLFEGRRIHRLVWNLNSTQNLSDTTDRKRYIVEYVTSNSSITYVLGHIFCEILNFVNVLVQLAMVCKILKVPIVSLDMLTSSRSERADASVLEAFPLSTKCFVYTYGYHQDVQKHSTLCLMSINGVMETVLIYLWLWFVLLFVLSAMAVVYRVALLMLVPLRIFRLQAKAKLTGRATVEIVTRRLGFGQWFLLYHLSKNMDPMHLRDVLEGLSGKANYVTSIIDSEM